MFIISLTYKVDIENGKRYIPEYHSFLQNIMNQECLLLRGEKSREPVELSSVMLHPELG